MEDANRELAENRDLTAEELNLVRWLLNHGKPKARTLLPQLDGLRVMRRCPCGCASIDFQQSPGTGMEVISDHQWEDEEGNLFGVFLFSHAGVLAGLEVWSTDGDAPRALPDASILRPAG